MSGAEEGDLCDYFPIPEHVQLSTSNDNVCRQCRDGNEDEGDLCANSLSLSSRTLNGS